MSQTNGIPASYDAEKATDPRDTPEKLARDDAQLDEWQRRGRISGSIRALAEDLQEMADQSEDDTVEIGPNWFEFQWAKIGESWGRMERAAGVQDNRKG